MKLATVLTTDSICMLCIQNRELSERATLKKAYTVFQSLGCNVPGLVSVPH
jgi:hypothetical protein